MKKSLVSEQTKKLLNNRKYSFCDIGCGKAKQGKDWFGIDYRRLDGVDLVQDLEKTPWPIPSESFDTAVCSHVMEHINPSHGIFVSFVNECWRILKPGAEIIIGVPYATSTGMYRDPTHINFINEETFCYFDPEEPMYKGGLYNVYNPLPWRIKINAFQVTGNMEIVLVKREIKPEYKVDTEYLRLLALHTKQTK